MSNDVYVRLRLQAEEFQRELDESKKKVENFEDSIDSSKESLDKESESLAGVTGVLTALGAGFVATGLAVVSMTDNLAEGVFEADRYAKRLDIATTELIALQKVAKQFGVDAEDVNEGLKNMKERLGEAFLEGRGATFDALKRLGVNLEEIKKLNTSEQFFEIAKALRQMDDAGERTFEIMEIFQEEGFKMAEVLSLSENEFQKLYKAEKQFADNLNIGGLRDYKEKTDELNASFDKLSDTVGSSFAGALASTSSFLSDVIDKVIELHTEFSSWDVLQEYNDTLKDINKTLGKIDEHEAEMLSDEVKERELKLLNSIIKQEQVRIQLENIRSQKTSAQILEQTKWYRDQVEVQEKLNAITGGGKVISSFMNTYTEKLIEDTNEAGKKMFEASGGDKRAPDFQTGTLGLLERGSAAEASVKSGEQNKLEMERNKLLKEILAENKKRRRQFEIQQVSL